MRVICRKHALAFSLVSSAVLTMAVASCRAPTEVLVEARTNVPYRDGLAVSFTVGGPNDTELGPSTTQTIAGWGADGFVGSLDVVPGSADDAQLSVKLVLGLRRQSRDCVGPRYEGCIVARRRLRYTPHERLRLPILLYARCEDVPCDADTTCNAHGACVPNVVDPITCGSADGCEIGGDLPSNRDGGDDATASDAGVDAQVDSSVDASGDAPVDAPKDAPADGPKDGGTTGTPGFVACPPNGCLVPTQQCCFNPGSDAGVCQARGAACTTPAIVVTCDGSEDCPGAGICCGNSGGLNCSSQCAGSQICQSDEQCPVGAHCKGTVYRQCQ